MDIINQVEDPRLVALIDVIRRSGASEVQIRYDEEQAPIVWVAVAAYKIRNGKPVPIGEVNRYIVGADLDPLSACFQLAENIYDGGTCVHCQKPTGITNDWAAALPVPEHICWYVYDPETQKFRRSCEGDN